MPDMEKVLRLRILTLMTKKEIYKLMDLIQAYYERVYCIFNQTISWYNNLFVFV